MSCRALGRDLEKALLVSVINHAKKRGCTTLSGSYKKTKKNSQVAKFYEKASFQLVEEGEESSTWQYSITGSNFSELNTPPWINLDSAVGGTGMA
jgi:predicted enzyme involved in methoxymalonyl-ACP biosynthesis